MPEEYFCHYSSVDSVELQIAQTLKTCINAFETKLTCNNQSTQTWLSPIS